MDRPSTGNRRNPQTHRAIIDAVREILSESDDLTFEEVARRSGAGKSTIYRWWPQKFDLFLEVYKDEFRHQEPPPDLGDVQAELECLIAATLKGWANTTGGKAFRFLLAQLHQDHKCVQDVRNSFMPEQREFFRMVLQRGRERDQLREGLDLEVATDMLFGFTWHCLLSNKLDQSDPYLRAVMDTIFHGIL